MFVESSARRRFYLVGADMRANPSDFEFVNREQALIGGKQAGSHEVRLTGLASPRTFGVPPLRERPALVVGINDDELLDIYGLGRRYVSTRAKTLLETIDPQAFEFAECTSVDRIGRPVEPYWMVDVVRVVCTIDEAQSNVVRYAERNPQADDAATNPFVVALNDVYFPSVGASEHAFHYLPYLPQFVFDDALVDAWRDAGLTGALFTPLQPPTRQERLLSDHFANYPFWNEQG